MSPPEGGGGSSPEAASTTTEDTARRRPMPPSLGNGTGDKCGGNTFLRSLSLGSYALGLAGADLPVFPLLPHSKRPRFKRSFHDATCDVATIAEHWQRHPQDNIGIPPLLGMAVLDVDPGHGGWAALARLFAEYGLLPHTWSARTGSGGRHLWFVVGQMALRSRLGERGEYPGIDVKSGANGYIVAPPSMHPSGSRYEWLNPPIGTPAMAPRWLLELMRRPVYIPAPVTGAASRTGRYSLQCLARRIERCAVEGDRNNVVYGVMRDAFKQGDLDSFEDVLSAAAMARGLPPHEVAGIVRSARGSR